MLIQIFQKKGCEYYLLKKELSELPDDSPNIFKKSNIERYAERPSATFCNGKYIVLSMLHANKPGDISQRDKLDDHQEKAQKMYLPLKN